MISANVIAKTKSPLDGAVITTLELIYPRFIHAELMTHRVFSRNSASSRAVPVSKMIESVRDNMVVPVRWGSNQKGMQSGPALTGDDAVAAELIWLEAAKDAMKHAQRLSDKGVHKEIVNRILEPYQHQCMVLTSTKWNNFFALRCHPDAQPEIQKLAYLMRDVMDAVEPTLSPLHIPLKPNLTGTDDQLMMAAAARCARVSYARQLESRPLEEDLALAKRLFESGHMSPFEHIATACKGDHDNFRGWRSLRKQLEGR